MPRNAMKADAECEGSADFKKQVIMTLRRYYDAIHADD